MNLLRKFNCFVFGHDMELWQQIHPLARRVICNHCGGDWGINDDVRITIPWTPELEQLYERFGIKIRKRPANSANQ